MLVVDIAVADRSTACWLAVGRLLLLRVLLLLRILRRRRRVVLRQDRRSNNTGRGNYCQNCRERFHALGISRLRANLQVNCFQQH